MSTTLFGIIRSLALRTTSLVATRSLAKQKRGLGRKFALAVSAASAFAFTIHQKRIEIFAKENKQKDKHVIEEADKLYNMGGQYRELYDYLKKQKNVKNCSILWRLARAARDLALKGEDVTDNEKKELIYEAFNASKEALDVDESDFAAHKWYAITIGDVGDYEGTKVKISNAFLIRDHLERATELNPSDATTLHCLGMWCFAFADMPWWQHKMAAVIFGTPPSSTYKEAADYFMQAERVDPNFYSVNLLMLGKTYIKMNDHKRAMLFLDRVLHYPILNTEDENAKVEAEVLLKSLLGK
uniref:regulator of microtubule dynamics protein 1 n=1 Tax=Ciona intestinalis TaxID=7719 RepID=UPI000180C8DB|nr:regulator of microtubule dynamics protein 1 [Ciona intestinalis]|eukprot:XP_026691043.1 regulator of microtubule dynamics protein 1 [Ciona intestinalis]